MRTKNSFLNFLANEGSHFINIILSFICRTVFVYTLSSEYLGVNGLFGNILTVLNLAELGIGTAMNFHIYKPVAENNYVQQQQLMNLYKKMYTVVGTFIGVVGLCLTPFLSYLIKDEPDIEGLTVIYLLYLFGTVSTYFFSYKRAIIDAHQKQYIGTMVNTVFTITQFLVQIIVLLVFRNFIAFLLVMIICGLLTNITVSIIADRMYPYLKEDRKSLPSAEVMHSIKKNVSAMFLHRLGDVFVNNTDNLILSKFVGLASVGIYSNYIMIMNTVRTALNGVFGAVTASVGNLHANEDKESLYRVYKVLLFLGFWLYGFCSTAFVVMYNPFIEQWIGKDYLFDIPVVLSFVAVFYINGMRAVTITFRDAMGLYWYDSYKPIFEVIINLVASIYLVIKFGAIGVFLGTVISDLTTCCWIEPLVTYKYGFKRPVRQYFVMFGLYSAAVAVIGGFTYWLCDLITVGGWLGVFAKLGTCIVVYNVIVLIAFCRTYPFKELYATLIRMLKEFRHKGARK